MDAGARPRRGWGSRFIGSRLPSLSVREWAAAVSRGGLQVSCASLSLSLELFPSEASQHRELYLVRSCLKSLVAVSIFAARCI